MRKVLFMFLSLCLSLSFSGLKAQEYIAENPFETMIKLGSMNVKNPIYQMPSGQAGSAYIVSAITSGDAVRYPLGYAVSSAPDRHFVIVSKATTLIEKERQFNLIVKENTIPSGQVATIYTDWNRDGVLENAGQASINSENKSFEVSLQVPADAELGKTRIRVRLESSQPSGPDVAVASGRVYDFVVYVMDKSEHNDCYISVSSNNENLGTAIIETASNANGRYDKGASVTVKATPSGSSDFEGWKVGQDIVSTDLSYTFTVTESVHIIAVFSTVEPVLAEPQASTEAQPVWYQIMNAHTASERANRYIAYDENTTGEYASVLRAERPADISDKFLWRLETTTGNKVRIINKADLKQIYGTGVLETQELTAETVGSEFVIAPSGNANGSYSIKYNGNGGLLLNAQDSSWKIVLYNAGIGTGSGWYFYHVPLTPTGVTDGLSEFRTTAVLSDGVIILRDLPEQCSVKVFNLSGQIIGEFVPSYTRHEYKLKYPEEFVILMIKQDNQKPFSLKLYNRS
ncbi:GEVED domain-containing protein [Coprobacter sp.]